MAKLRRKCQKPREKDDQECRKSPLGKSPPNVSPRVVHEQGKKDKRKDCRKSLPNALAWLNGQGDKHPKKKTPKGWG